MRALLLLLFTFPLIAAPVTVLDPAYDKLDLEALNHSVQKFRVKAATTPDEKNEELLAYFFLAERAYFEEQPHTYFSNLNKAEKICELNAVQDVHARFSLSCALLYGELSLYKTAFSRLVYMQKAKASLAKAKQVEPAELFYVEGRLQLAEADPILPKVAKSVFNFQLLLRAKPEITQTSYWIAHAYHLSGNTNAFKENLIEALKANNLRTKLKYGRSKSIEREYHEGIDFGGQFALFASQLDGLGALYRVWDERIFDKRRDAEILLSATTRKNFGLKLDYGDREVIEDYRLGVGTSFQYRFDEFYGLGLTSAPSDKSVFRIQTWDSYLSFSRELVENFHINIGWTFHQRHTGELVEGPFASYSALSGENLFYSGGYFKGEFNLLESEDYSLSGGRLRVKGFFPTKDLLSNVSFQKWNIDGQMHTSFFGVLAKLQLATALVTEDAPLDALVEVKSDLHVPGVRPSRYRDKHLSGAALEFKRKVFGPFVLGAYATTVLSKLDFNTMEKGAGGLLEVYLTRRKEKQARLEMGAFNGEFTFGLDLGFGL